MARRRGRSVGDVTRYTGASARPPSFRDERDDEPITSGATFALIAFVAFAAIAFMAVRFGTQSIEDDLAVRSSQALAAAGFETVDVEVHGTTVSLSGSYLSGAQDPDEAFALVASVPNVGAVDGQIWPDSNDEELDAPVVRGAPLEAEWVNGSLTVTGNVSTDEKRDFIATTLDATLDTEGTWLRSYDMSGVTVVEGLSDESAWLGSVLSLVQTVPDALPVGLIRADGSNEYLVVSGDVLDRDLRDDVNQRVTETAAALGFDVNPAVRLIDEGPTEEEVTELQDDLNDLVLDQVVEFEVDSFALTEQGRVLLNEVLTALERAPDDIRILITGHTDDRGSAAENQLLSEQRAKAVLDYLVAAGQDPDRFDIIGYGETRPVASNDTEEGRAQNRRIAFEFDGAN